MEPVSQIRQEKIIKTLSSLKKEMERKKNDCKIRTLKDLQNLTGEGKHEESVGDLNGQEKEDFHQETGLLSEEGERETELLIDNAVNDSSKSDGEGCYLIRLSTKEKISIIGREFVLGRSEEQADYAITNNKWISNIHASILTTNEGHYIRDLGSMNHTYLNDILVKGHTERLIQKGAIIRLEKEDIKWRDTGTIKGA